MFFFQRHLHYLVILSFFLDCNWHSRFNSFNVVFRFIVDDQNRMECFWKEKYFCCLVLTTHKHLFSPFFNTDLWLGQYFLLFLQNTPFVSAHKTAFRKYDEEKFLRVFLGWGEVVLHSFRTMLQLVLFRHNVDSTNHLSNFGVPNTLKMHFSIH